MFANVLVCLDIPLSKPPTAPSGENVCQPMEDLGLGQVTSKSRDEMKEKQAQMMCSEMLH